MEKYAEIEKNECLVEEQFTDDADIVIAAYGTTARICPHRCASGARRGHQVRTYPPDNRMALPQRNLPEGRAAT